MNKPEKIECAACELMVAKPQPYDPTEYSRWCTWGKSKPKLLTKPTIWRNCNLVKDKQ